MVLIWLAAAVVLLIAEVMTTAFFAIFLAVGAAVAGVVAAATGNVLLEVLAFAIVSVGGVAVGREPLMRRVSNHGQLPLLPGVGQLVGQVAITVDAIGDEHHPGHAQLAGERWLAVTDMPEPLAPSQEVVVVAVRGTTLLVRPTHPLPALSSS
ncbi:MAG: NfeD family protein [Candidatus Dormibacteraeota bacterium]|nr:NfeD family protein [Candidatus Dormibacteraeota bacterium]